MHGKGPYSQLDLSREQREQIRKIMGEQMHERKQVVDKYLEKLSPADQKAMKDEMAANHKKAEADCALLKPDQPKKFDEIQKHSGLNVAPTGRIQGLKAQQAQSAIMRTTGLTAELVERACSRWTSTITGGIR